MASSILIIAGTHQREIDFTHTVADRLITEQGGNFSKPHQSYNGIDGARRADLWTFDKIAIGKIVKTGEVSRDFLETKSNDWLKYLCGFKINNRSSGAEIAESFEGPQYTSVHDFMIEQTPEGKRPSFFIDLHSYHRHSRNLDETAGDMNAHLNNPLNFELMKRAFQKAQTQIPEIYGTGFAECPLVREYEQNKQKSKGMRKRFDYRDAAEGLSRNDMLEILTLNFEETTNSEVKKWTEQIPALAQTPEGNNQIDKNALVWGNNWHLRSSGRAMRGGDSFTFEGVHWGKRNQDATVKFITEYLLPNV